MGVGTAGRFAGAVTRAGAASLQCVRARKPAFVSVAAAVYGAHLTRHLLRTVVTIATPRRPVVLVWHRWVPIRKLRGGSPLTPRPPSRASRPEGVLPGGPPIGRARLPNPTTFNRSRRSPAVHDFSGTISRSTRPPGSQMNARISCAARPFGRRWLARRARGGGHRPRNKRRRLLGHGMDVIAFLPHPPPPLKVPTRRPRSSTGSSGPPTSFRCRLPSVYSAEALSSVAAGPRSSRRDRPDRCIVADRLRAARHAPARRLHGVLRDLDRYFERVRPGLLCSVGYHRRSR